MDVLAPVLNRLQLQTHVFHTGELCSNADFSDEAGVGYIHSIESGQLELQSEDGSCQTISAPATIFYSRPTSHQLRPAPNCDMPSLVCGSIDFGTAGHSVVSLGLPSFVLITEENCELLAPLQAILFKESAADSAAKQNVLDRLCEVLVIQMLRHLMADKQFDASLLAALADPQLSALLTDIHTAPSKGWTLDSMAQQCGMSRAPFANHFKTVMGIPPAQYLSHWRLALVKNLLSDGSSISSAAYEVGYESPSAMARAFKKLFGESPSDWLGKVDNA